MGVGMGVGVGLHSICPHVHTELYDLLLCALQSWSL